MRKEGNKENAQSMLTFSEISSRCQIDRSNFIQNVVPRVNSGMLGSDLFSKSYMVQQKRKNSQSQLIVENNNNSNFKPQKQMFSQLSTGIEDNQISKCQIKTVNKNQNTSSTFFPTELKQDSLFVKKYSQKLVRQQQNCDKIREELNKNQSVQEQNILERLQNSLRNQNILEKELIRLKKAVNQQNSDICHNNKKGGHFNIDSIINITVCPTRSRIFKKKQEPQRQKRYQTWDNRFFNN